MLVTFFDGETGALIRRVCYIATHDRRSYEFVEWIIHAWAQRYDLRAACAALEVPARAWVPLARQLGRSILVWAATVMIPLSAIDDAWPNPPG